MTSISVEILDNYIYWLIQRIKYRLEGIF